jgi:hemoglobin
VAVPTLYEWAGGSAAFERLTEAFYRKVRVDPLLARLFAAMPDDHPHHVAMWLAEVFRGPEAYSAELGGYPRMMRHHLDRHVRPEQRTRWVALLSAAADEVGLPDDPEFRSAFVAYLEWGSRIAMANSQPGATPPAQAPIPHWGWGEAPPYRPG